MLPKPPIAYLTTRSAVSAVSRLLPFALTPFCSCQEREGVHRRALSREALVATKLRALCTAKQGTRPARSFPGARTFETLDKARIVGCSDSTLSAAARRSAARRPKSGCLPKSQHRDSGGYPSRSVRLTGQSC